MVENFETKGTWSVDEPPPTATTTAKQQYQCTMALQDKCTLYTVQCTPDNVYTSATRSKCLPLHVIEYPENGIEERKKSWVCSQQSSTCSVPLVCIGLNFFRLSRTRTTRKHT